MKLNKFIVIGACIGLSGQSALAYEASDYQDLLNMTVKFYGAQRSGDTHNWLLKDNPVGQSCFENDGEGYKPGYDLSGGWMDAGDFIKFTQTISYSAYALLKSYEVWPSSFDDNDDYTYSGKPNNIPDVLDEVKVATDYLLKIMPNDTTLISRVGGNQDHDYLYTCPAMAKLDVSKGGGARPVYTDGKANIAGIAAAALARMAVLYRPYSESYADSALAQAKRLDVFGQANLGTTSDQYYPEGACLNADLKTDGTWNTANWDNTGRCKTEWVSGQFRDAMMCGTAELYRATKETAYLERAKTISSELGSHGWVIGWGESRDLCRHSLAVEGVTEAIDIWKVDVNSYISKVSTKEFVKGLSYFMVWGSLNNATSASFSSALLYEVTKEQKYQDFAFSQAHYVMGDNEYNRSFVVGWGVNPPEHPHHKNSFGSDGDNWGSFVNSTPNKYPLLGALVGGPSDKAEDKTKAGYEDDVADYIGNEVTIYYNSGLVGTLAMARTYPDYVASVFNNKKGAQGPFSYGSLKNRSANFKQGDVLRVDGKAVSSQGNYLEFEPVISK